MLAYYPDYYIRVNHLYLSLLNNFLFLSLWFHLCREAFRLTIQINIKSYIIFSIYKKNKYLKQNLKNSQDMPLIMNKKFHNFDHIHYLIKLNV